MSEFKELIKSFPKTREYVRDFFVYGFKTRDEFKEKSARTYDNERRRLESWLGEFVQQDYTDKGKNISLAIDSNLLDTNPLYRVWKTKSFTDNDILLHFYIMDYLSYDEGFTAEELTDGILNTYDVVFDVQTVRRKCNAYAKEGLLRKEKSEKDLLYFKESDFADVAAKYPMLIAALKHYQISAPFGIIGNTILDNLSAQNDTFRVKHSFFAHTLEDEVLLVILEAMQKKRYIRTMIRGSKSGQESKMMGVPLQIFTSTRTGRRFLCMYLTTTRHFTCLRLDAIKEVIMLEVSENYDELRESLHRNHRYLWGVTFQNSGNTHTEKIKLTLHIRESSEMHIVERLEREGKGGRITKIAPDTYTFETEVFDSGEMLPWIRTFTGRILKLECDSTRLEKTYYHDMEKMFAMYDI